MSRTFHCNDVRETASLHHLQMLPPEENDAFATHVDGCTECRDFVTQSEARTPEVGLCAPARTPPLALRARLLERIEADKAKPPPPPGITFVPPDESAWEPTDIDGVMLRILSREAGSDKVTALFRMAPNTSYPRHRHSSVEECYVLEGDLRVGDHVMRAGEFQRAEEGTVHERQSTENGCLLLVIGSTSDERLPD